MTWNIRFNIVKILSIIVIIAGICNDRLDI